VLKRLPFGLDASATKAVRNWAFEPATLNGEPVRVSYVIAVSYQAEKKVAGAEAQGTAAQAPR
jgi:outer membrane biosynthesis protein TonB